MSLWANAEHKEDIKRSHCQIQGKTAWVDPACADCPGFVVLGAAPAPGSTSVSEPQIAHLASILLRGPFAWICCPQLPYHPCENGTHSTCFTAQGGTRRQVGPQEFFLRIRFPPPTPKSPAFSCIGSYLCQKEKSFVRKTAFPC